MNTLPWRKPEECHREHVVAINISGGAMLGWITKSGFKPQWEESMLDLSIIQACVPVSEIERDFTRWQSASDTGATVKENLTVQNEQGDE